MKCARSLSSGLIVSTLFFMGGCATAPKQSQPLSPATKQLRTAAMPVPTKKPETALAGVIKPAATDAHVFVDPKELDSVISVFSEAIKRDSNYAGAYYNRAKAYFYMNEFDKSWQDVHKAESLGCKFSADFLELLKRASGKEK